MNVLDLFSGIGGFSLGLERAGMETVAFCEIDKFCQKVLNKHWPDILIHEDITKLDGKQYAGTIDLICGGYPCQPFSVAGKQKGSSDARHLWPEMFRIIKEVRPSWVIAENVEGHVRLGLDTVLDDLEGEGYTCWPFIIPACAVAAPHQRNRVWIIANAEHARQPAAAQSGSKESPIQHNKERQNCTGKLEGVGKSDDVANIDCFGLEAQGAEQQAEGHKRNSTASNPKCERTQRQWQEPVQRFAEFSWCENIRSVEDLRNRQDIPEPLICRGDDGFSKRVDRLRSLGNSVVPQIPEIIGRAIIEFNRLEHKGVRL